MVVERQGFDETLIKVSELHIRFLQTFCITSETCKGLSKEDKLEDNNAVQSLGPKTPLCSVLFVSRWSCSAVPWCDWLLLSTVHVLRYTQTLHLTQHVTKHGHLWNNMMIDICLLHQNYEDDKCGSLFLPGLKPARRGDVDRSLSLSASAHWGWCSGSLLDRWPAQSNYSNHTPDTQTLNFTPQSSSDTTSSCPLMLRSRELSTALLSKWQTLCDRA